MTLIAPHLRETTVGRADIEAELRALIETQRLSNGWMIAGPKGSGKASLAWRIARAVLEPGALAGAGGLDVGPDSRAFRLIAAKGHPDVFVAERPFDEKNDRYLTEISVETIRELSAFLSKTAGFGGWRVAIVDCADELNRNAANALLKSLEEPPERTLILLIANQPGRLLPTIRSRCRRLDLRPLPRAEIVSLLTEEGDLDQASAEAIADVAKGRPGYALTLAAGEGVEATQLAEEFIGMTFSRRDPGVLGAAFAGKSASAKWEVFIELLLQRVGDAARAAARAGAPSIGGLGAHQLAEAHARMQALASRGDALNIDRGQMLFGLARALKAG